MVPKNKVVITVTGIVLVALFWIYWVSVNPMDEKAMVKFISVQEVLQTENYERVRIGGIVEDGSIILSSTNKLEVVFTLKEGDSFLPVEFIGTRPDLFKNGAEVIVEGLYQEGSFHADILQTKCASRYEGDLRDPSFYNLDEIEICPQFLAVFPSASLLVLGFYLKYYYHYTLGLMIIGFSLQGDVWRLSFQCSL